MMKNFQIDFDQTCGRIKPMHAVNNGPIGGKGSVRGISNAQYFEDAHIPYARTHDASFCASYGGESIVDVHRIFRNFDADENDPAAYSFTWTDKYLASMREAGTEPFYRLGASIEHKEKRGTYPPKDFAKWARVCEHIIRHYTEGWADGYTWKITYWEIWNEPDCRNADGSAPCWQGTWEQFFDLFITTAKHLKKCFPHLKIGGPAICTVWNEDTNDALFSALRAADTPLDFFSYHWYGRRVSDFIETVQKADELCEKYGYGDAERILNEYNYVKGWLGDEWRYSLRTEKNEVGAAFILSCMLAAQNAPVDMLMYYDARPSGMNGLFTFDTLDPLKLYYAFYMFGKLYAAGEQVALSGLPENVYGVAAKGNGTYAVMLSYFSDEENAAPVPFTLSPSGLPAGKTARVTVVDKTHDGTEISVSGEYTLTPNSVLFIEFV